jgi:hypothetical protein
MKRRRRDIETEKQGDRKIEKEVVMLRDCRTKIRRDENSKEIEMERPSD